MSVIHRPPIETGAVVALRAKIQDVIARATLLRGTCPRVSEIARQLGVSRASVYKAWPFVKSERAAREILADAHASRALPPPPRLPVFARETVRPPPRKAVGAR